MRLLLLGAPGSGKGTQARRLAEHFGVAHLATGDMLRAEVTAGTDLGQRVAGILASGDLVPDEVIEDLLHDRFIEASQRGGFVLDGFPRTLHQAEAAYEIAKEAGATVQAVVYLDVPEGVLLDRLLGRGEGRSDDREATIRHRLAVYEERTKPLIDYYDGRGVLITIDGAQEPAAVFAEIVSKLHHSGY